MEDNYLTIRQNNALIGKIFNTLMGREFETWYKNEFMNFVEGGIHTCDKNRILNRESEKYFLKNKNILLLY